MAEVARARVSQLVKGSWVRSGGEAIAVHAWARWLHGKLVRGGNGAEGLHGDAIGPKQ